jgi:hypothetical protein
MPEAPSNQADNLLRLIAALLKPEAAGPTSWFATPAAVQAASAFVRELYAHEERAWPEPAVDAALDEGVDIIWRRGGRGVQVQVAGSGQPPHNLWRLVSGERPDLVGAAELSRVRELLAWACRPAA